MTNFFVSKVPALVSIILIFQFFNGCQDSSVTTTPDNIDFSYTSTPEMQDRGGLILDTAKILLKDIKLNVANSTEEKNFKTGVYVLYLSLNSQVNTIGSAYIPIGTYDKVNFEIHKHQGNEPVPDPDFVDSSGTYSVVAKGWWNGVYFIFKSDITASHKLRSTNSLVVTETKSNITLKALPYLWFTDSTGEFLDPNDPNNRIEIEHNIKDNVRENFRAFKDNDKNGIPDN